MKLLVLVTFLLSLCACKTMSLEEINSQAQQVFTSSGPVTQQEISLAFKQALEQGAKEGVFNLSKANGFFKHPTLQVPFPPDAQKLESQLRKMGFNQVCDDFHKSVNHAAEKAVGKALPIFSGAITSLTFADTLRLLKGHDTAITDYLKRQTEGSLIKAFRPIVEDKLDEVSATKYWNQLTTTYNRLPLNQPVATNLVDFVTAKAIQGLFTQIASEEQKIRKNPAARTTQIMQKVFSSQ